MVSFHHYPIHELTGTEAHLIYALLLTFRLNVPSDPVSHVRSSFCHRPNSVVVNRTQYAGICGWSLIELDWQWRFQLVAQWICVLVQASPCIDFDGSDDDEQFIERTGVSPREFARAYLEAEESLWRAFTPTRVAGRNHSDSARAAIIDAMLALWAEQAKRWAALPAGQTQAKLKTLHRFGDECMAHAGTVLDSMVTELLPRDNLQHARVMLARAVQAKGTFDCIAHADAIFCDCEAALDESVVAAAAVRRSFVDGWITELIKYDEAFVYDGDRRKTRIQLPSGDTISAVELAEQYLDDSEGLQQYFTLTAPRAEVIQLMLHLWQHQARHWRQHSSTRREARAVFLEHLKDRANHFRTFIGGRAIDPTHNDADDDDPLVRSIRFGSYDHRPWALLYAVVDRRAAQFEYRFLRYVPCHRNCDAWAPLEGERLERYLEEYWAEDEERAWGVVPDWSVLGDV